MIRTVRIPKGVSRMGLVQAGSGVSAGNFSFDPTTGLSNDPTLAPYLQDLTFAQLQSALNGQDPSDNVLAQLYQEQTGTGAFSLPCGGSNDPTCSTISAAANAVPMWAWIGIGALVALAAARK